MKVDMELALAEARDVVAGKSRSHVRAAANMAPALLELHRRLEIALFVADELRAAYRRVDPAVGHDRAAATPVDEVRVPVDLHAAYRRIPPLVRAYVEAEDEDRVEEFDKMVGALDALDRVVKRRAGGVCAHGVTLSSPCMTCIRYGDEDPRGPGHGRRRAAATPVARVAADVECTCESPEPVESSRFRCRNCGNLRPVPLPHGGAGGGDDDTPQCPVAACIFVAGSAHPNHHQDADGKTWATKAAPGDERRRTSPSPKGGA